MSFYRASLAFLVYTFVYAWIDLIPFANSLAPPSNNPDVLRSYVLRDNNNIEAGSSRCWETLLFDPSSGEEEDEVELVQEEPPVSSGTRSKTALSMIVGVRTAAERDAELREQAIVLEE